MSMKHFLPFGALCASFVFVACGGSVSPTDEPGDDTSTTDDTGGGGTDTAGGSDTSVPPTDSTITDSTGIDSTTPDGTPTDGPLPDVPTPADVITPVDGACPTGLVNCAGACVDLTKDPKNCARCGTSCPPTAACVTTGATTACTCPTGQIICGGACVDPTSDAAHCGSCTTNCGISGACVSGKCTCPTGATTCGGGPGGGGTCTDITKDPNNCGGCFTRCNAFGSCTSGKCACPTGSTACGGGGGGGARGVCADTTADPSFCGTGGAGGCGVACGDREYCDGTGKCACRPGLKSCTVAGTTAPTCLNTAGSPFACGDCGKTCLGTEICIGGACKAAATACPTGQSKCTFGGTGGTTLAGCYDLNKDDTHCGTCGTTCNNDEICVAGRCRGYVPAVTCTTCPCTDCNSVFVTGGGGGGATCCPKLPGQKSPICVSGTACP